MVEQHVCQTEVPVDPRSNKPACVKQCYNVVAQYTRLILA